MHPSTSIAPRRPRLLWRGMLTGAAMLAGMAAAPGIGAAATPACPWLVQPHGDGDGAMVELTGQAYDIVLDGDVTWAENFYGFTLTDVETAWQLTSGPTVPDLRGHGHPLRAVTDQSGATVYRIAEDTLQPHIIYMVAARDAIDALEAIDARIEPERPVAVSFRTRGGSDITGPLPKLSLQGVEVKAAAATPSPQLAAVPADQINWQICAYQVARR